MAALPAITWGSSQTSTPPPWLISQAPAGLALCPGGKGRPQPAAPAPRASGGALTPRWGVSLPWPPPITQTCLLCLLRATHPIPQTSLLAGCLTQPPCLQSLPRPSSSPSLTEGLQRQGWGRFCLLLPHLVWQLGQGESAKMSSPRQHVGTT